MDSNYYRHEAFNKNNKTCAYPQHAVGYDGKT